MKSIHYVILTAVYDRMRYCKNKLEIEESGKFIANLQGKISGYNLLLDQMKKNIPFLDFSDTGEEEVVPHDMDDSELVFISMELLTNRCYWDPIEKFMKYQVAQDKHYLYYDCKKSRDIDVIHGKRDGMLMFKGIFQAIKNEINDRREEEPLFKEDLEKEGMDLELFDFESDIDPAETPELFEDEPEKLESEDTGEDPQDQEEPEEEISTDENDTDLDEMKEEPSV